MEQALGAEPPRRPQELTHGSCCSMSCQALAQPPPREARDHPHFTGGDTEARNGYITTPPLSVLSGI